MTEPGAPRPARPPVPVRGDAALDRRAVERVLARAAELQAARGSGGDNAELLTERQLVEIAREVGLDPADVGRALAEERTRIIDPTDTGFISRTFGPAKVAAGRTLNGSPAALLAALDKWMEHEECMRVQRRFPDRIVWEPRSDLWGSVRRSFGIGGRKYDLANGGAIVGATVVGLDGGRVLVALDADLAQKRKGRLHGAGVVAGAGAGMTALLLGLDIMLAAAALAPLAGGSALGWMVARGHRGTAQKMQLALEQVLDRLEYGEARAGRTLAGVLEAARRPLLR